MNFIKKLVDGRGDEFAHIQLQKFSRGEFQNRAMIQAKLSKGKYTIGTTPEFANEMVYFLANKLGDSRTNVSGSIITTSDLDDQITFKTKKQFQGVKNYSISSEFSGKEILNLLSQFPKAFFALSFSHGETTLKIKPKMPKSGKPSSKGESIPKADFCKLVTTDKELGKNFIFESDDFSKAMINHKYFIEKIIIPEELKDEKDFAIVREKSLREGKIIRTATIDDKEIVKEILFRV
jgi:hypothetical protein